MPKNQRKLVRPAPTRMLRTKFLVATEGNVTEKEYFSLFNSKTSTVQVKCIKAQHSSPMFLLKAMKNAQRAVDLRDKDEAWMVLDRNGWEECHLHEIFQWAYESKHNHIAMSNPNFELWLLLHFENGRGAQTSAQCTERLKRHIPGYNKHILSREFTLERIKTAIRHAKSKDTPQTKDWPREAGKTTVYRLVEKLI